MAANVRKAITGALRADSALIAELDDDEHVYHRTAPQNATEPFVILFKSTGTPEYSLGGAWLDDELWTVKAVGRNAEVCEVIDERILTVLQDAALDVDGHDVRFCKRESDVNYGELDEGAIVHHIGSVFRVVREAA